eukprot:m.462695 g.462695  ORF g.462695 m.462695 type:complete len:316 (+) comp20351_c1_seq11:59-1006(+)
MCLPVVVHLPLRSPTLCSLCRTVASVLPLTSQTPQPFSTYSMSLCGQTTAGPGPCSTPTAVTTDEDIGAMAPPRWVTAGGAKVVRWDLIDPAPGLVLWYELRSSQDFRLYLGRGFEYMLAPALNDIVTSMSVRVATRAGVGPWSPTAQRHASSASAASPWTLSLIGICLLSVALVAGTFLLARRKRFSTKATELWEAVDEWQLEPAWLEKTSRLGAGAFGEVFAGRFKHRKDAKWQCCAIKCCRPKSRRTDKENLIRWVLSVNENHSGYFHVALLFLSPHRVPPPWNTRGDGTHDKILQHLSSQHCATAGSGNPV